MKEWSVVTAVALIRLDSMEVEKGWGEDNTLRAGHPNKQHQTLLVSSLSLLS